MTYFKVPTVLRVQRCLSGYRENRLSQKSGEMMDYSGVSRDGTR